MNWSIKLAEITLGIFIGFIIRAIDHSSDTDSLAHGLVSAFVEMMYLGFQNSFIMNATFKAANSRTWARDFIYSNIHDFISVASSLFTLFGNMTFEKNYRK